MSERESVSESRRKFLHNPVVNVFAIAALQSDKLQRAHRRREVVESPARVEHSLVNDRVEEEIVGEKVLGAESVVVIVAIGVVEVLNPGGHDVIASEWSGRSGRVDLSRDGEASSDRGGRDWSQSAE